tara:strand:+ start:310 stop:612 length:303 start_codon:yes stop_codon:yes gene_type:complete
MYMLGYPLLTLVNITSSLLYLYSIIIIAVVIISWVNADPYNPIVRLLNNLTEPVFAKVRKRLPTTMGGLDLTPIIVLIVIQFISGGILPIISRWAHEMIN